MTRLKAQDQPHLASSCFVRSQEGCTVLELRSDDQTNRLTLSCVLSLIEVVESLAVSHSSPLILTGNQYFFCVGADLNEILRLAGAEALNFARLGQRLTSALETFPAPTVAVIRGYCIGGGLDLALACRLRFAAPNAVFGYPGAALGLITGWGGTQRLTRLVGRAQALQMFTTTAKLNAADALRIGLVTKVHEDPLMAAIQTAHDLWKMQVLS